jgi:outer membrane protein assembly factor BamB
MNIKVLCPCGAKFRFDVEPVRGRMPAPVQCPTCGADATELANVAIAQQIAAAPPPVAVIATPIQALAASVPPPTPVPIARTAIATVAHAAPPPPPTPEAGPSSTVTTCPKHRSEMPVAECFVCHKPICNKCMEQFGYLCSSYCKGQAEARKLKVPVFEGQIFQKQAAEGRSQNLLIVGSIIAATALFAVYLWYWFVLSKPRQVFRIETLASVPFLHAEWISDDRFFGVTPAKVALFNSKDGSQVWALDLPKGEINASKSRSDIRGGEDEYYFEFEPKVKLVSKDIWVGLPTRVLRLDAQTGKKKAELVLPQRASDYRISDTHLLAVSRNETNDSKLLTRIGFADGRMDSVATPATSGARQLLATVRPMKGLGNTSLKNFGPEDEEFSEYNSISYGRDPDFIFTTPNVAHFTRRLIEERIAVQTSAKKKSGPLLVDSGNLRASQGMAAAEEMINQSAPDQKTDQSLYEVTIERYFGGGPAWTGQVAGRPFFFAQKTVDLLVAGQTLIVFNKNNQKLWEAKLTYPIAYEKRDTDEGPALEVGSKLLFYDQGVLTAFDLKKGDVQWRVNSVGITSLTPDGRGNIYLSSSTAGPENIRYTQQVNFNEKIYPMIVKVELKGGKVLWQSPRVGSNCQVSDDYVYTSDSQISGLDMMKTAMGGDGGTPVHWRLHRLNPSSGAEKWEWYREGAPQTVRLRGKQILLHFKKDLRLLKYM